MIELIRGGSFDDEGDGGDVVEAVDEAKGATFAEGSPEGIGLVKPEEGRVEVVGGASVAEEGRDGLFVTGGTENVVHGHEVELVGVDETVQEGEPGEDFEEDLATPAGHVGHAPADRGGFECCEDVTVLLVDVEVVCVGKGGVRVEAVVVVGGLEEGLELGEVGGFGGMDLR